MSTPCKECGYPLTGNESACPECGCPTGQPTVGSTNPGISSYQSPYSAPYGNGSPAPKTDWAQYFYECGVIGWEAFKKYCVFTGRASRREFWSFVLIAFLVSCFSYGLTVIVFFLPCLGVWIRRMHDIGKNGWWCNCPIVNVFLALKRSDEGANKYGHPNPAKNLL